VTPVCAKTAKHKHILLIDGLPNDGELLASAYAASRYCSPFTIRNAGHCCSGGGLAGANIAITKYGEPKSISGRWRTTLILVRWDLCVRGSLQRWRGPFGRSTGNTIRNTISGRQSLEQTAKVYARYLPGS